MTDPTKQDIATIFKRLRSQQTNKQCFDCNQQNPTWASLDTSWTWLQLRAMQMGGNANAIAFFTQHGCTSKDAQQKYNSRAAALYRDKLHTLASKAMQQYGTKVLISGQQDVLSPQQKEVDFFKEHEDFRSQNVDHNLQTEDSASSSDPKPISNGASAAQQLATEDDGAPSVEAALSMSPTEAQKMAVPRKATIGTRKPTQAKKGVASLGAKKGLGAQKVSANFKDIEASAHQRDKERADLEAHQAAVEKQTKEDEEKKLASMRLAYQDLTVQEKKREKELKHMDPKKKEQAERLGMGGFGAQRGISHSVVSDMTLIQQEGNPRQEKSSFERYTKNRDMDDYSSSSSRHYDDDFEVVLGGGFSSGPPKYDDSPFGLKDKYSSNWGNSGSKKSSWEMDRSDRFSSSSSDRFSENISSARSDDSDRGRSRKNYEAAGGDEAQKKFGNAKAISSASFYGNKDADFQTKQTLSKFEGQSSISSSDFFGDGPGSTRQNQYNSGPDLSDIKDGVRQGVSKVAGKLSNIANGVMSSLQDNYG